MKIYAKNKEIVRVLLWKNNCFIDAFCCEGMMKFDAVSHFLAIKIGNVITSQYRLIARIGLTLDSRLTFNLVDRFVL